MNEQFFQQYGVGIIAIIIGILGWVLPYKWNILRLKRGLANLLPEKSRVYVPKVLGTILIIIGVIILAGQL